MSPPMPRSAKLALAIGIVVLIANPASAQTRLKTRNVVLIVLDGVRWQEVFTGADSTLLHC